MRNVYRLPPWRMRKSMLALDVGVDWAAELMGLYAAWKTTRGAYPGGKVRFLSIDTGVQCDRHTFKSNHPDLLGQLKAAKDFTGSPFGYCDVNGHGTATVGLIAGKNDGLNIEGVCSDGEFYIAKALGDDGTGDNTWISRAIDWGRDLDVDIITFSGGSDERDDEVIQAMERFLSGRDQRFMVAAAGNNGKTNGVNWPAAHPDCLAVGAIDRNGVATDFSSRGAEVDIAAPGKDVRSCALDSKWGLFDGTSFSAPLVAGAVGLLLAKHRMPGNHATPLNNITQLRHHLNAIARHVTDLDGNSYPIARADEMLAADDAPPIVPEKPRKALRIGPFRWSMPARGDDLISLGVADDAPADERNNAAATLSAMMESLAMVVDSKTV